VFHSGPYLMEEGLILVVYDDEKEEDDDNHEFVHLVLHL